jgi:hypothetical protein
LFSSIIFLGRKSINYRDRSHYVLDGHFLAQLQRIALKLPGVAAAPVGKAGLHLLQGTAGFTKNPLHGQHDEHGLEPDGYGTEAARNSAFAHDLSRTALRAAKVCFSLMNFKSHLAATIAAVDMLVAADTEGMVQKACGHEGFLSSLKFGDDNEESPIVHFFSTPRYAKTG